MGQHLKFTSVEHQLFIIKGSSWILRDGMPEFVQAFYRAYNRKMLDEEWVCYVSETATNKPEHF